MRPFIHRASAIAALLTLSHLATLEGQSSNAATAVFNNTLLTVTGTGAGDNIVVSAETFSGNLEVMHNGQSLPIVVIAGIPNKANLALVSVDARGGSDTAVLDESLNTVDAGGDVISAPNGVLLGGSGDDTLASTIGSRGDNPGRRIIGNVAMDGGGGDDRLISGFGNDLLAGGPGNDTLTFRSAGHGRHRFEGGGGKDVAEVWGNSANLADSFRVGPDPASPGDVVVERTNMYRVVIFLNQIEEMFVRTQTGEDTVILFGLTGTTVERVAVDGGDGNDVLSGFSLFGDAGIPLRLDGGAGEDALTGGSGNDFLNGGPPRFDPDIVIEVDTLRGGPGADVFRTFIGDEFPDFNPAEGDFRY